MAGVAFASPELLQVASLASATVAASQKKKVPLLLLLKVMIFVVFCDQMTLKSVCVCACVRVCKWALCVRACA